LNRQLIVASANPGKIKEIKAILSSLALDIISASDLDIHLNVREIGSSYIENATIKAKAYQAASGQIVLADDSGLEVDALDGAPGIYSARYADVPNATDADRRKYLLTQLQGKPQPWSAHFHCSAILATPSGEFISGVGRCNGIVIPQERGTNGFGYDPIFLIPEEGATLAELSAVRKNQISHRARALQALIPAIKQVYKL
jgi:XTP/dITP diphosphohydrolase